MGISAAFSAVLAGSATVAEIATVVSVVGTGMSVVGAITGNKELTKIGGIMGLAGGVVSLASGALGAAGAAEGAAVDTSVAGTATDALTGAGADLTGAASAANPDLATGDFVGSDWSNPALNNAPPTYPGSGPDPMSLSGSSSGQGVLNAQPQASTPLGSTPQASQAPGTQAPYGQGSSQTSLPSSLTAPPKVTGGGLWSDIKEWFSGLPKDQQGRVMSGLLETGGKALGGMFQGWSEEQKLALQQHALELQQQQWQTALNNASAQPSFKAPTGILNAPKAA